MAVINPPYQQATLNATAELNLLKTALNAAGAKARLFKSTFAPTPASVEADFVAAEADYSGYAAQQPVFVGPFLDAAGVPFLEMTDLAFSNTTGVVGNVLGGMWLENAAGALYGYVPFIGPLTLNAAGSAFTVDVRFSSFRGGAADVVS